MRSNSMAVPRLAGAFTTIVPATPGSGLLWNISSTLASGVHSVIPAVNTTPTNILTTTVTSGNLALSWPADHIGWRLQVQTNDLVTGLATNWSDVAGATTTNLINVTLDPANGTVLSTAWCIRDVAVQVMARLQTRAITDRKQSLCCEGWEAD